MRCLSVDGLLSSGKLSASKQKSSVSTTNATNISQLLKTLFGGICDSRVNFDNILFDDLGVWIPDRVNIITCVVTSFAAMVMYLCWFAGLSAHVQPVSLCCC